PSTRRTTARTPGASRFNEHSLIAADLVSTPERRLLHGPTTWRGRRPEPGLSPILAHHYLKCKSLPEDFLGPPKFCAMDNVNSPALRPVPSLVPVPNDDYDIDKNRRALYVPRGSRSG